MPSLTRIAATVTAAIASITVTASPANATPGGGVSAVTVFDHVVGSTRYVLREITIAPGGSTGWHYHSGPVFGVVRKGVLTHNEANCSIDGIYRTGQAISEAGGSGYVHIGRNLGSTPVVLEAFYRAPAEAPLAISTPNPGCSFE